MLGIDDGAPLVVRRRAPALRAALLVAGVLIGIFALYVTYELGRYDAGYDRQAVAQQRTELEVQIEHLDKDNRELRTKLAELDTIRLGRAHEQADLARSLGDLQAQVARQSQELAFYRGVVAQGAATIGVKIEQLRITAGSKPASYIVHMSLVRSGRADTDASGIVHLSLDGSYDGTAKSLDLPALTAGKVHELRYNFRYLENFDQEVTLPLAFKPEQLAVEVQSSRHDLAPLSQTFLWTIEASP
jgi:Family of unknown function (DUF6776)